MKESRDFQDAESVRSGQSHIAVKHCFSHLIQILVECQAVLWECPSRKNGPPDNWNTHGISGNVCVNPPPSSSSPYPGGFNPWISNVTEDTSPHVTSESQTPVQDQRCQSAPSARNAVVPSEGRFSKDYGADQQRLQISDPHFDKFTTSATSACWKTGFKTEVCICSQFPTEAVLWIKEVEMVDSVDGLMSSLSVRWIRMPDFDVLDAKIASALNRIIHNTQSKRKVSLEEQKPQKRTVSHAEDRLLTWSTSTSLSLEATILSRIMPTYLQLFFEMMIFRNSKWGNQRAKEAWTKKSWRLVWQ